MPDYLSDEEAACVPLTALQAFELMGAKPGDFLFISGGTGSLGAMAVPIAAGLGLRVATSGNGNSEERMRALGATTFVDYRTQDYADALRDVDYVLDSLGDRELEKEFSILKPGGTLVSLKGLPNGEFARRAQLPAWKRAAFALAGRVHAGTGVLCCAQIPRPPALPDWLSTRSSSRRTEPEDKEAQSPAAAVVDYRKGQHAF